MTSPEPMVEAPPPLYHISCTQQTSTHILASMSMTSLLLPTSTVHTLNTPPPRHLGVQLFHLGILRTLCQFKGCQGLRDILLLLSIIFLVHEVFMSRMPFLIDNPPHLSRLGTGARSAMLNPLAGLAQPATAG